MVTALFNRLGRRVMIGTAAVCLTAGVLSGCESSKKAENDGAAAQSADRWVQVGTFAAEVPTANPVGQHFDKSEAFFKKYKIKYTVAERSEHRMVIEFDARDLPKSEEMPLPTKKTPTRLEYRAGKPRGTMRTLTMRSLVDKDVDLSTHPQLNQMLSMMPMGLLMEGTK